MFEAFRVQSTFVLKDETLPALLKMAAEVDRLDKKVKAVQKNMDMIAKLADPLNRTAGAVQMISRHLSTAETRSGRLLANLTGISRLKFNARDYDFGGLNSGDGAAAAVGGGSRRGRSGGGTPMPAMEEPFYAPLPVVPFARPPQQSPPAMPSWPVGMMAGGAVGRVMSNGDMVPPPGAGGGGRGFPPGGMPPWLGAPDWIPGNRRGGNPWDRWDRREPFDGGFREPGGGVPPGMPPQPPRGPFFGHGAHSWQDMHAGAILTGIGAFGTHGLYGATEAAGEYQLEQLRLKSLGMSNDAMGLANKLANENKQFGVTASQSLALIRDAQQAFRDSAGLHHAEMVFPLLSKLHYASGVLGDAQGQAFERQFMDVMKVAEFRGGMGSKEAFERQANMMFQASTSTGNRVRASDYLTFLRNAGISAYGLNDRALYYGLEPILQELGPSQAATGMQTAYNRTQLGIGLKQAGKGVGQEMLRIGFLDPKGVEYDKKGMFKQYKPGAHPMLDKGLMYENPIQFYTDFVIPHYKKAGIISDRDRQNENALIFGRTGGKFYNAIDKLLPIIQKSLEVTEKAMTISQAAEGAAGTKVGAEERMAASWKNFATAAGLPSLQDYTTAVNSLSGAVETGTKLMNEHQTATKVMAEALGVLFGAAMIGGAWKLTKAAAGFVGLAPDLAAIAAVSPAAAAGLGALAAGIGRLPGLIAAIGLPAAAGNAIADYMKPPEIDPRKAGPNTWEPKRIGGRWEDLPPVDGGDYGPNRPSKLQTTPPGGHRVVEVHTTLEVDGKKMAKTVTKHQAKEANKPQSSASRPDGRRNLQPVAGSAGR
ncbi:hypothetical protein SAMN02949497_3413 [Methylomagnum ishizawai]|uniref:Uncharacterized protein n=1 Tax=Methylomagnum ishizawai TaxID=1760988 RepID=A0A1Y6D595_9GAMM|nr:hypothetical protein [Methylomagnum ishizawai]SMF96033.1 hypothetical protein SAMN02949497_3413 [Methylomagnum ishizawai]